MEPHRHEAAIELWQDTPKEILGPLLRAEKAVDELSALSADHCVSRKFTLDGRLIGDIGELLVAMRYQIASDKKPTGHTHDLIAIVDGQEIGVQVKLRRESRAGEITFKNRPEILIVLQFLKDWKQWRIVFHGSGKVITDMRPQGEIDGTRLSDPTKKKDYLGLTLAELEQAHQSGRYREPMMTPLSRDESQKTSTPMNHYLAYWKADNAVYTDETNDGRLLHAASDYFSKLYEGDEVWIVTSKSGVFYLLGSITVGDITDTAEAESRLDRDDLYDANYHIFPADGEDVEMKWIEVTDVLPTLRFSGTKKDRLPPTWGAGNLQTMRHLTKGSAETLERLYEANERHCIPDFV